MKRRNFLLKAGAGAAAASSIIACSSANQSSGPAVVTDPKVNWNLCSSYPRSLDTIYGAAEFLSKRVSDLTDGKFTIRVYPAGELVPGLQVMDAVQQGTTQIGHTAAYYFTGKSPVFAFDCSVPFGLNARQQNAWLYHGGGSELLNEVYANFNIISFPGGNTGAQMGGWFRKELKSVADLKALKMRIPGLGGEVMSRLGATVQVLAGGEIYPALERGAIDATEWVGPYDDEKLGFYKVAKFYYYPGWWEPGPNTSFFVNKTAWEKLPSAYRHALQAAMMAANMDMTAKYDALNPPALMKLLANGVQLRPFGEDIMTAARTQADALMEELSQKDAAYRKVYENWRKFREETFRWFACSELTYANFSFKLN